MRRSYLTAVAATAPLITVENLSPSLSLSLIAIVRKSLRGDRREELAGTLYVPTFTAYHPCFFGIRIFSPY